MRNIARRLRAGRDFRVFGTCVLDLVVNRQVRGRARHSSGRLQVSRKRLSYSDKEQVSSRKTPFVIFGSLT